MNKIKIILLFLIALLVSAGCDSTNSINSSYTIIGSANIVTVTKKISYYSGITVERAGNIYLVQDTSQNIRIEADDNIIGNVILEMENGVLITGLSNGNYSNITLRIFVPVNGISQLSIIGAGNIIARYPISSDALKCSIEGAGYIYVEGSGDSSEYSINGSGTIDASNFIAKKCKTTVYGFGFCSVYASDELDAEINGAGIIYYYGNPSILNTSITGTGQIINKSPGGIL